MESHSVFFFLKKINNITLNSVIKFKLTKCHHFNVHIVHVLLQVHMH